MTSSCGGRRELEVTLTSREGGREVQGKVPAQLPAAAPRYQKELDQKGREEQPPPPGKVSRPLLAEGFSFPTQQRRDLTLWAELRAVRRKEGDPATTARESD